MASIFDSMGNHRDRALPSFWLSSGVRAEELAYCEGDVTCFYRTKARQWDAISEHAFTYWKNGQAHGPDDLPEAAAELPSRYRMPYAVHAA